MLNYLVIVVILWLPSQDPLKLVPVSRHEAVEWVPDDEKVSRGAVFCVEQFQLFCIGDPRIELVDNLIDPATVSLRDEDFLFL